jgi:hypothetical protein
MLNCKFCYRELIDEKCPKECDKKFIKIILEVDYLRIKFEQLLDEEEINDYGGFKFEEIKEIKITSERIEELYVLSIDKMTRTELFIDTYLDSFRLGGYDLPICGAEKYTIQLIKICPIPEKPYECDCSDCIPR